MTIPAQLSPRVAALLKEARATRGWLARHAYRSRMKSEPPAIIAASFKYNDGHSEPVAAEALKTAQTKGITAGAAS
jgi:hypothetical protein